MIDPLSGFGSLLVALASVLLVPTSAWAAPRVPTHVACVGDSITYGYGASNQATKSYPANLQTLFGAGVQVKNFGHNGAIMLSAPFGDLPYEDQTEYTAAGNFVSGAGANAVVDVIIMLGTNDSKNFNWAPSGQPKNDQQFLNDYRAMVEHFSGLTPKPLVFLALPPATGTSPCCSIDGSVIHDEILPLIEQLATEKNLPTIDLNTPTTGHPEYFGDGVHPTDAAYVLVAQWMHDGLLAEQSSAGSGGGGGSAGMSAVGSAGDPSAGGGSSSAAGAGAGGTGAGGAGAGSAGGGGGAGAAGGGAPQTAGTSSGVAGSAASAGGKSTLPPQSDAEGCVVSRSGPTGFSPSALVLLGLGFLGARRRRLRS
ncbi:MAG: GDSL-type esterase/lipase family protein [Pseudomonadota bacterium]